jgi:twinkle protein
MRTEKVLSKMFSMHLNKSFYDFTEEDLQNCMVWFSSKKLFFIDVHGKLSIETIREYLEYSNRKYDVKFALLDHLHYFIKSGSDSIVGEIEEFMRGVVSVALQTGMHIMLIAHPSKLSNSLGQVSMNDIKGASAIKQDAHNVATIWRDREKEKSKQFEVVFDLQKVRDDAGVGGSKRYLFNPQSQVYTEKTEESYGQPEQDVERAGRYY